MDTHHPAEAVEILDLLLKFFGEGERWIKGRFSPKFLLAYYFKTLKSCA